MEHRVFNVDKARTAGASEMEILNFLGEYRGYNVDAAIRAGATRSQIIEFLASARRPDENQSPVFPLIGPDDAVIGPRPTGWNRVRDAITSFSANYGDWYNPKNLPKLLGIYNTIYNAMPTGAQNVIDFATNNTAYDQALDDGRQAMQEAKREAAYRAVLAAGGTEEEAEEAYYNAISLQESAREGGRQLMRGLVSPLNMVLSGVGAAAGAIGLKTVKAFQTAVLIDTANDVREVGGAMIDAVISGDKNQIMELLPMTALVIGDAYGSYLGIKASVVSSRGKTRAVRLAQLQEHRRIVQAERAEAAAVAATQAEADLQGQIQEGLAAATDMTVQIGRAHV